MDIEIFNTLKDIKNFNYNHRNNTLKLENHNIVTLKKFSFDSRNKRMGVIIQHNSKV